MSSLRPVLIRSKEIAPHIRLIRGLRVMLDEDLARIYGVSTKRLNEQVKRNRSRFPEDFVFQLSGQECRNLMSQIATSSLEHGGRRKLPYAFTEHGAIMLAAVLNTPVAIQASVGIVRAFVRLRRILSGRREIFERLDALEKSDAGQASQIRAIFDAIRELMDPGQPAPRRIGFRVEDRKGHYRA